MRARCGGGGSASAGAQRAGGRAGALLQAEEQLRGGAGRAASNAPRAQMPRCHAQGVGGAPRALQKPGRGVREGRRRARTTSVHFLCCLRAPSPAAAARVGSAQRHPNSPHITCCTAVPTRRRERCEMPGGRRACVRARARGDARRSRGFGTLNAAARGGEEAPRGAARAAPRPARPPRTLSLRPPKDTPLAPGAARARLRACAHAGEARRLAPTGSRCAADR